MKCPKFPVKAEKFPVIQNIFPAPCVGNFVQNHCGTAVSCWDAVLKGSKTTIFPVKFQH
jgi:hypothetical protein